MCLPWRFEVHDPNIQFIFKNALQLKFKMCISYKLWYFTKSYTVTSIKVAWVGWGVFRD